MIDQATKSMLRRELRKENKILGESGQRRCRTCMEVKSLEFFYKDVDMPLGKSNVCISCQLKRGTKNRIKQGMESLDELTKAIARENRQLKKQGLKRCGKCHEIKNVDEFSYSIPKKSYANYCRACYSETYRGKYHYTTRDDESLARMRENSVLYKLGLKKCKLCGQVLSLDEYHKASNGKSPYCKNCWTIHVREQRKVKTPRSDRSRRLVVENRFLLKEGLKHCSKCDQIKPLKSFSENGKNKNGKIQYMSQCRRCRAEYENKRRLEKLNKARKT